MLQCRSIVAALICFLISPFVIMTPTYADKSELFSLEQLKKISPRARDDIIAALYDNQGFLRNRSINTPLRVVHFLAQIAAETNGFSRLDEDLVHYTAPRLARVFKRAKLTMEEAEILIALPIKIRGRTIANRVYGDFLGNRGRNTDDGWDYRGSGYIQLTGRFNFIARGQESDLPLEQYPELARSPKEGLMAAIAYWRARGINSAADTNDIRRIRILVNGSREGLGAAQTWLGKIEKVIPVPGAAQEAGQDEGEAARLEKEGTAESLLELGYLSEDKETSASAEEVSKSLLRFQHDSGLPETGQLDEDTLYALTDPNLWRQGEPLQQAAAQPLSNESAPTIPDKGVVYDLQTGSTSEISAGSGPFRTPQTVPSSGTVGIPLTEASVALLEKLMETRPVYAPYERHSGIQSADGSFVPYSVIDPDSREVIIDTTTYPASTVLQFTFALPNSSERFGCTGVMISKNVALTAGHCVNEGGPDGAWHRDFVVIPARNGGGTPFGTCSVTKTLVDDGWIEAASDEQRRFYDLGAIQLDCDVGLQSGWVNLPSTGAEALSEGIITRINGYPCDKTPNGKQWISRDRVRVLLNMKIFYQNDTFGCMSGSPVFEDATNRILAIHTNGLFGEYPWNSNNAGTTLDRRKLDIIQSWMEEIQ